MMTAAALAFVQGLALARGFCPAETAPKDGSTILVMWVDGSISETHWTGHGWEPFMPPYTPTEIAGWYCRKQISLATRAGSDA